MRKGVKHSFSQFKIEKIKNGFKQPYCAALLNKSSGSNYIENEYKVIGNAVLQVPTSCSVSGTTLVGVSGTVTNNTLILE